MLNYSIFIHLLNVMSQTSEALQIISSKTGEQRTLLLHHWATMPLSSINAVRRKLLQNLAPPSYISYRINLDMFRFEERERRGGGGDEKENGADITSSVPYQPAVPRVV